MVEQADEFFYVLHPEEPELHILVSGRMLHFTNGRLEQGRDVLTKADLSWFQGRSPRFIVTSDLNDPALQSILHKRLIRTVGRRAHASDLSTTINEAELLLALMTSHEYQMSAVTMADAVAALTGTFEVDDEDFNAATEQVADEQDDAAAITAGLQDTDPDEIEPDGQVTSDAGLPEEFVAPETASAELESVASPFDVEPVEA